MMKNCVIGLLFWSACVFAQPLEILSLRHRSAEQLIPQLQPFVEAGGALSGMNDKLFLRASTRNHTEIRELVKALDTPLRRLRISLRQDGEAGSDDAGASVNGRVRIEDGKVGAGATARVYSSDRRQRSDINQYVQTVDGGRASIMVGQSFIVPLRQVVLTPAGVIVSDQLVQRDVGSGFVAVPKLSGDQVTLEISPVNDTPGHAAGSVNVQRLTTTVSGRLGEWLELGGSTAEQSSREAGVTRYGTRTVSRQRRLLLKVEEIQ
jgi:type II secretory pathway component GspD/PulD (secretin)